MIRNYKEIRGIEIDGVEHKLSQYANDTSIIFDGLPQSMDGILRELDCFACISTLKIISPKLKWYGSEVKKISKEVFRHSRWKLDWKNPTFDLLGVKFSVNLNEMVELNYPSKFLEVTRLIKQWKLRHLTTVGRLTVIKTLIIP